MLSDELEYHVNEDVPCAKCRYNVRGIDIASRCPECGSRLVQTLQDELFQQWFDRWSFRLLDRDAALEHLAAHLAGGSVGAIRFVCDAVWFEMPNDRDIGAREIVECVRQTAMREAPDDPAGFLLSLGIVNAMDVGRFMFAMVEVDLMRLSPGDQMSDFEGIELF